MPRDDQRSDRSRAVQEFAVLDRRRVGADDFPDDLFRRAEGQYGLLDREARSVREHRYRCISAGSFCTAVRLSDIICFWRSRHNPRSPWPGLARPSTPSFRSTERLAKTWVPTEQVRPRGIKGGAF